MANTYLSRTFGTPTNANIWTYSVWIKRSFLTDQQCFFGAGTSASDRTEITFSSADICNVYRNVSGSSVSINTTMKFRDISGWYNLVFQNNSGTLALYVNGEVATLSSSSLGTNRINQASTVHHIGDIIATGSPLNALMSHINFVDGTIYAPSYFGETDATTGEWKIKASPSVTYGNNGFFILKDGNTITDSSPNSNNWSLASGTLTKTEDCPSNVFATLNTLERLGGSITVSNGNTQFFNQASDWRTIISNLAFPNTGKFYAEMQVNEVSSAVQVGIMAQSSFVSHFQADLGTQGQYNGYAYMNTGQKRTNSSATNYGNSFAGGIIGIAVDMDNKNIYFSKDGVWQNSGNPESGATGTNAAFTDLQIDKDYCFAVASQGSNPKVSWNFGNGYFGTTAVSSAGTNASGNGIFEYDTPTGYTALSTKGLNL